MFGHWWNARAAGFGVARPVPRSDTGRRLL